MSSARCKSSCLLSQGNWQDSVSTKVDPGLNTTLNGSAISRTQLTGMSWEQDGKRIDISSGSSVHSYYLSPRGGGEWRILERIAWFSKNGSVVANKVLGRTMGNLC